MGPAEATTTGGTVDGMSEAARLFDQRADPRTNTLVKAVLRAGLGLSMILLVVGLVVQLARGEELALPVKMFKLFAPHPVGEQIMGVGVLVLTLTPALGVLSVVLSWARERDRTYVLVGFAVVCVLFTSVAVGFGFG
jgi:uncharacterized membrane protein